MNEIDNVVKHLERQRDAIERALSALREVGPSDESVASVKQGNVSKRRTLSPAARKKMAEAARKRWAGTKSGVATASKKVTKAKAKTKAKGGISEAGRKKLAEAMRRRWAVKRAGSKAPVAKKATKKAAVANPS